MLLTICKFFLYASLFCVVIVLTGTFFPFIGGKYYFFRITTEFALMFFLFWWAFEARPDSLSVRARKVIRQPMFIAVVAFVLISLLAAVFAHDPHSAFWSNFERGDGAFQMLHYFIFFFLLVTVFQEEIEWRRLFYTALIAAVLLIAYGVAAAVPIDGFVGPLLNSSQPTAPTFLGRLIFSHTRFQASLGNPAYVAPYLIFAIAYALYLWFSSAKDNTRWRNIFFLCLVLFYLLFFVLSETRGAFLGLAAGTIVFLVYLIFSTRFRILFFSVLAALLVVGGTFYHFRNTQFVTRIPGSRFLQLDLSEATANTRFWTWGSAWKGVKERPLLGWGEENFTTVFDKHFDPRHFVPGQGSETWFDRAHSVIFDYLAEMGFLGLLSYLGIFIVFYWQLFRLMRKEKPHREQSLYSPLVYATLMSLPIAYLVQGLVLFDELPVYINLFFFFAFAVHYFASRNSNNVSHKLA